MLGRACVGAVAAAALCSATQLSAAPLSLLEIVNTTTSSTSALVVDGLHDAFDGAFSVSGLGGLTIDRRIDTLESIRTYRVLDIFSNNTASPITTTVNYSSDLGSDGHEFVVEEGPYRAITFQDFNNDGLPFAEFDPVLAFTFGNNAFAGDNGTGDVIVNGFSLFYDLIIEPGEAIGILQFATLIKDDTDRSGDVSAATMRSDALIASPDLSGLTTEEIASISNFSTVSEPRTLALLGIGLALLGIARHRRKLA
jgi:hypothetical protein